MPVLVSPGHPLPLNKGRVWSTDLFILGITRSLLVRSRCRCVYKSIIISYDINYIHTAKCAHVSFVMHAAFCSGEAD